MLRGMALVVSVRGQGTPVVLVHSGGMSGRQWRKLAELLEPSHRVIVPDLLGSGDNPPWPDDAPFHFEQDLAELEQLLAAEQPAHLIGHSYGGLLTLLLARKLPVRSLSLFDPVAFGVLHDQPDRAALLAASDPLIVADEGGDENWFRQFVDYWNGAGTWAAMPQPARDGFLRVGRKVFLEVKSLLADRTPASGYAHITAPTLLLTGERTPPAERRVMDRLAAVMPRARLEVIDGAGHMGPITHAPLVNTMIAAHLQAADAQ